MAVVNPTITRYDNHAVYRWVLTGFDGVSNVDTAPVFDTAGFSMVSFYLTGIARANGSGGGGSPNVVILAYPDGATAGSALLTNVNGTGANLTQSVTSQNIEAATPFMGIALQGADTTLNGGSSVIVYMVGKTRAAR